MGEREKDFKRRLDIANFANNSEVRNENLNENRTSQLNRKNRTSKSNRGKERLKKVGLALGFALVGMTGYHVVTGNEAPNLEEILENGGNLEDLKMSKDSYNMIQDFYSKLENVEELSDNELKEMIKESREIQYKILKEKIGAVYKVSPEDISLLPTRTPSSNLDQPKAAAIMIGDKEERDISSEIEELIEKCQDANDNLSLVNDEDEYNRDKVIKALKDDKETIDGMATIIFKDEEGKLVTYKITLDENEYNQQEEMER